MAISGQSPGNLAASQQGVGTGPSRAQSQESLDSRIHIGAQPAETITYRDRRLRFPQHGNSPTPCPLRLTCHARETRSITPEASPDPASKLRLSQRLPNFAEAVGIMLALLPVPRS